jgi:hypothetical protein
MTGTPCHFETNATPDARNARNAARSLLDHLLEQVICAA